MKDYVEIEKFDDCYDLAFYIDDDKIMAIGEKIKEIVNNEFVYMNGEDWGILLDFYIEKNAPELIDTYDPDPEACTYAAAFEDSSEGEKAAQAMADIIISLVENEDKLIDFVREFGDEIEWD